MSCFQQLWPRKWRIRLTTEYLKYGWWTKSCTTKDDDYPIAYRVLTIPGGAGFCPSTVCLRWSCQFPCAIHFQVEEHFPYFQRPFAHLLHPDCNCTYGQQQLVGNVFCFVAGLWIRAFQIFGIDIDPLKNFIVKVSMKEIIGNPLFLDTVIPARGWKIGYRIKKSARCHGKVSAPDSKG